MTEPSTRTASSKRTKFVRIAAGLLMLLLLLALAAPWIVARCSARDWLVNRIVGTIGLRTSTQRASLGWFSPLAVEEVEIRETRGRLQVAVKRVTADRSWPMLLASAPNLGTISVEQPHVYLQLPLDQSGLQPTTGLPTLTAALNDAALTVYHGDVEGAVIDVHGIDATLHIRDSGQGHLLTIDPVDLFSRQEIMPQLRRRLLQLISPSLGDAVDVEGQFSLSLDTFEIPLGVAIDQLAERIAVDGTMMFHQVTMQTDSRMLQALSKPMADLFGEEPQLGRVVQDSVTRFSVRGGRLFHENLRFGFPDIDPELQVVSSGSVGLDQTLDLRFQIPRLGDASLSGRGPVQCRVTGTVSDPVLSVKDAPLLVQVPDRPLVLLDIDAVDLTLRMKDTPGGRVISVDPVVLIDRQKLSNELASNLIQLIEPELQHSPQLSGEISMSVDKLHIPFGGNADRWHTDFEVQGKLAIHQATSLANTPLRQTLVKLLADLYGKQPLEVERVTHDDEINFALRQDRLHYEGLQLSFPEIDPAMEIHSRGSIGIDQTLDLWVELPRPAEVGRQQQTPVECHITGTVDQPEISVKDAPLVIRLPGQDQPILEVDAIDLDMRAEAVGGVSMLTVAPLQVLEKQRLTVAEGADLLRLVAPTLGDVADIQGEVSLAIETLRLPLAASEQERLGRLELAGRLQLHEISTRVKTPLLSMMVKVLADMHGRQPSDVVRVAKDADVHFEFRQGRLLHEGLRIGFPDISPDLVGSSRGSVGLDRSLDLVLDLPKALVEAGGTSLDQKSDYVRYKITGTIEMPIVEEVRE